MTICFLEVIISESYILYKNYIYYFIGIDGYLSMSSYPPKKLVKYPPLMPVSYFSHLPCTINNNVDTFKLFTHFYFSHQYLLHMMLVVC